MLHLGRHCESVGSTVNKLEKMQWSKRNLNKTKQRAENCARPKCTHESMDRSKLCIALVVRLTL